MLTSFCVLILSDIQYACGSDHSNTIESTSKGVTKKAACAQTKRKYPPTKTLFWEEQRYNPLLQTINIDHAYDAQHREQASHWSKSGKKFSEEPRFPKHMGKRAGDGTLESGYLNPEEIPNFDEKQVNYFEKPTRKVIHRQPRWSLVKKQTQLSKRNGNVDERVHLGPGYYELFDPWMKILEPVCGIVRPTSSFARSHKRDLQRIHALAEVDHNCSYHPKQRLSTTHERQRLQLPTRSRVNSRPSGESSVEAGSPIGRLTHPSSTWGGFIDRHPIDRKMNIRRQASREGFSFTSQVDNDAPVDLSTRYYRMRDSKGYYLIIPVRADENPLSIAPSGCAFAGSWATTDVYAKNDPGLKVDASTSTIPKSKKDIHMNLNDFTQNDSSVEEFLVNGDLHVAALIPPNQSLTRNVSKYRFHKIQNHSPTEIHDV